MFSSFALLWVFSQASATSESRSIFISYNPISLQIIFPDLIGKNNEDKKKELKNNIINNIITNRRIPYLNNKDKDRDKDRDRDKDKDKKNEENKREIKRPKPVINHYESYSDDDESDEDSESLDNLANSLSSLNLNPGDDFGQPKSPIFLSPLIFSSFHDNFTPSTYSSDNEFNKNDIIKAI